MYGMTSSAVSLIRAGIREEFRAVPENEEKIPGGIGLAAAGYGEPTGAVGTMPDLRRDTEHPRLMAMAILLERQNGYRATRMLALKLETARRLFAF